MKSQSFIHHCYLYRVEGLKSALSLRNFCTFTGLFLIYILKPKLSQKHSICSQNHFALFISTAGLSCCEICLKNDQKIAKREGKWHMVMPKNCIPKYKFWFILPRIQDSYFYLHLNPLLRSHGWIWRVAYFALFFSNWCHGSANISWANQARKLRLRAN